MKGHGRTGPAPRLRARGPVEAPDDLARCPALLFSLQPYDRWILIDRAGERRDVALSGRVRANDSEALLAAAEAGFGIALLPHWIAGDALRTVRAVLPHTALQSLVRHWE